jgi:hypothetical protein
LITFIAGIFMVYDYLATFTKEIGHQAIEWTFPRTSSIALVSAFTGWYSYQFGDTYLSSWMADSYTDGVTNFFKHPWIPEIVPWLAGKASAPIFVPGASKYINEKTSLGVSLATSLTLNILAAAFFGIKAKKDQPHLLPSALKGIGIHLEPPTVKIDPPKNEEIIVIDSKKDELQQETKKRKIANEVIVENKKETSTGFEESDPGMTLDIMLSLESQSDDPKFNLSALEEADPVQNGCCRWKLC